ncbi:MAG: PLP-dependent aminotransferase family protein [Bilophila wadsworthia]
MKLLRLYQDQAREHPGEAKYMLVANAIAQGVEDGCLAPGESCRRTGIGRSARRDHRDRKPGYAEAAQRGLTVGVTGRGTFVTAPCHDVDVYEGAGRMHDLGFIAPFEYLNPDLNEAVAELSRYADLKELSNYQQPRGLLRHREAGAHWAGRYGLAVSPENLLVCAGAQHALLTVLASLFNPGDRIAAEQLSYPLLKQLARRLRLSLTPVRMDQGGMLPDSLEAACRAGGIKGLYLMPTCQNPTLAQIPEYRRRELVEICRRYDVMIIEDDVYALSLEHNLPPLASLAPERCCFIASTSEALSGGLRIAYLCPPDAVFAELERTISYTISMAPPLMAELATMWIRNGTADRVLAAKRREAAERNALARQLLDGFPLETRTTGFFCWLKLPDPWLRWLLPKPRASVGSLWRTVTCCAHCLAGAGVRLALGGVRTELWRTLGTWLGCCTGRVLWGRNIGEGREF